MIYQLADTTTPPPVQVAESMRPDIKAWAPYSGPFASPNTWTSALARQYLKRGLAILPIYVGQQRGRGLGSGTFTEAKGHNDGLEAVQWARSCGLREYTHVAFDVESDTVDNVGPELRVYLKALCETIALHNHYPVGYVPDRYAPQLEGTKCSAIWIPGGPFYNTNGIRQLDPKDLPIAKNLFPEHRAWQYTQNFIRSGVHADLSVFNFPLFGISHHEPSPHHFNPKRFLNRHALSTGMYGFEATGFYPGPLDTEFTGIEDAAGHEDIQVAHGTPFFLPAGSWICTQNYEGDGWGLTLAFKPQFGGEHEIVFMHMAEVNGDLSVGHVRRGGHYLGKSGGVPGVDPGVTSAHSGGAHLHLAYSYDVKKAILKEYGKTAFTPGVANWQYGEPWHTGGHSFVRGHTGLA